MLLGRRFGSLPGVAAAQILGLRARLAFPRIALPPLTPPVGRPLACRQALPRVRGSRLGILSTVIEHAAQGAWPPHWRPCYLWPPRRMPHGSVRRLWPRGPLWAARPDDPVELVRLRPGGRPACGAQENQTAGSGGRRCVRRPARQGRSGPRAQGMPQGARAGEAAPARHAPRSPAITFWPHAASSRAACSP